MKNNAVKRIISALIVAAMIAAMLFCASGCSENVFDTYQSDTFQIGENW